MQFLSLSIYKRLTPYSDQRGWEGENLHTRSQTQGLLVAIPGGISSGDGMPRKEATQLLGTKPRFLRHDEDKGSMK